MSYHEDDELNRLHEFMREEAEPVTGASLLDWLETEITEAQGLQQQFDQRARETGYDDYDNEISRHEQDGFVSALEFVLRKVKETN
jgi:hypothetical protein